MPSTACGPPQSTTALESLLGEAMLPPANHHASHFVQRRGSTAPPALLNVHEVSYIEDGYETQEDRLYHTIAHDVVSGHSQSVTEVFRQLESDGFHFFVVFEFTSTERGPPPVDEQMLAEYARLVQNVLVDFFEGGLRESLHTLVVCTAPPLSFTQQRCVHTVRMHSRVVVDAARAVVLRNAIVCQLERRYGVDGGGGVGDGSDVAFHRIVDGDVYHHGHLALAASTSESACPQCRDAGAQAVRACARCSGTGSTLVDCVLRPALVLGARGLIHETAVANLASPPTPAYVEGSVVPTRASLLKTVRSLRLLLRAASARTDRVLTPGYAPPSWAPTVDYTFARGPTGVSAAARSEGGALLVQARLSPKIPAVYGRRIEPDDPRTGHLRTLLHRTYGDEAFLRTQIDLVVLTPAGEYVVRERFGAARMQRSCLCRSFDHVSRWTVGRLKTTRRCELKGRRCSHEERQVKTVDITSRDVLFPTSKIVRERGIELLAARNQYYNDTRDSVRMKSHEATPCDAVLRCTLPRTHRVRVGLAAAYAAEADEPPGATVESATGSRLFGPGDPPTRRESLHVQSCIAKYRARLAEIAELSAREARRRAREIDPTFDGTKADAKRKLEDWTGTDIGDHMRVRRVRR